MGGELIRRSVERIRPETLIEASWHEEAFARETYSARRAQLNTLFHSTLYGDAERPFYL